MILPYHPEELRRLSDICHMVFEADVFTPCRERKFVDARIVFSHLLREQGMGCSAIGRVLGRDHATILHYFRRGSDLLETDKLFQKKYLLVREQYIGKDPVFYYTAPELRKKFMELRHELEDTKAKLADAKAQLRYDSRIQPILDMVRIRTKRGEEEEVANRINRIYNGL